MIDISRKRFDRVLIDTINNTAAISYSREGSRESVIKGNGYRSMQILSRAIFDAAMHSPDEEFNTKIIFTLRDGNTLDVNILISKEGGEFSQLIVTDNNGYRIYHTVSDVRVVADTYGVPYKDAFLGGVHERKFYVDLGEKFTSDPSITFYELDLRSCSILSEQRFAQEAIQA